MGGRASKEEEGGHLESKRGRRDSAPRKAAKNGWKRDDFFSPLPSDKANLVGGGGGGGALDGKRRMGGYVHGSMEEGEEFHGPRKFAIYEGKEEGRGRKRSGACLSSSGGAVGRSSLGRQQCPDKKVIVPPLPPSLHPFNFLHIFQEPNEPRRYFTSRTCCWQRARTSDALEYCSR